MYRRQSGSNAALKLPKATADPSLRFRMTQPWVGMMVPDWHCGYIGGKPEVAK
jgi:hypothetical protein